MIEDAKHIHRYDPHDQQVKGKGGQSIGFDKQSDGSIVVTMRDQFGWPRSVSQFSGTELHQAIDLTMYPSKTNEENVK